MDVSPRTITVEAPEAPPGGRRRPRNVRAWLLVAVVLAALGFVVLRGLGNATLFFYNVDEAVAKRDSLGSSRFRLQGAVVPGSMSRSDLGADFTITYNGVDARVHHEGDLPQLFQPGHPGGARRALVGRRVRLRPGARQAQRGLHGGATRTGSGTTGRAATTGHRPTGDQPAGRGPVGSARVNSALGQAGIVAGLVSSVMALITVVVALVQGREDRIRLVRQYGWMVLGGAVLAVFAMERALITRDFSVDFVANHGSRRTPRALQRRHHVVGPRGVDPAVGAGAGRLPGGHDPQVPPPPARPPARRRPRHPAGGVRVLLRSAARAGEPLRAGRPGALRRAGAEPAAAEPPAHGVPPAAALPRLRRLHGSVLPRHRRPGHRPAGGGLAGRDPPLDDGRLGLPDRPASSPAPGGPTRCWAGPATGRGTRWRTPRSCPG